jgi:hypothetical protein
MIAISNNSRRITFEIRRKAGCDQWKSLTRWIVKARKAPDATRLYRARLSNQDVIFVYVWAVQSLKGLFQPKAITAAMIKITTNSRRMTTETARMSQSRSI